MKTEQVYNLIILDESETMESIKQSIIRGFNKVVRTIKGITKQFPEQKQFISFHYTISPKSELVPKVN